MRARGVLSLLCVGAMFAVALTQQTNRPKFWGEFIKLMFLDIYKKNRLMFRVDLYYLSMYAM